MARTLLAIYPLSPRRYDEMLVDATTVRPHWERFFTHLDALAPKEMRQRLDFVDRRILQNGVTYNVYADPKGADRPWSLDPLPLLMSPDEWRKISAAVTQRARLMNAILADLYGEQRLLAEGLLPPALVYGQPGYLWPCRGVRPPGDIWLHLYAVDLARSPDGRWWVIADRSQAPSGAGYALENRLVISRVFPEMFRDLQVQPLADFFRSLQDSLAEMAPVEGDEQPHIVLLTPGPYNETYFEHAYLARYLGFPLVEGQDLTVRGETVFLKTVRGLKRVHAILRRVDDSYCDPVELRGDSALGVAGLLNAVRARRIVVANALGSGLLGSSAIMGFLPAICRRLLGEELAIPSVATWWCGEKQALNYVREHFDELVIKPACPAQDFDPAFGHSLDATERAAMLQRIEACPQAYVAQEIVHLSQAPIWSPAHDRRLLPRPVGLRVYVSASAGGYKVMPGGLARTASSADALVLSMQRGGSSKDVWVQADGPVSKLTLLKPSLSVKDLVRSGANLSSRVVESLFWLGRYSERFDATARMLRVALTRLTDSGDASTPTVQAAVRLAEYLGMVAAADSPAGKKLGKPLPVEKRLLAAIHNAGQNGSLAANIRHLLGTATHVRERLSLDHWHSLNSLQRDMERREGTEMRERHSLATAIVFMDRVLAVSSSLTGFAMDNMTRDDGWRFLIVGRRIERLDFLARAISKFLALPSALGSDSLEWLLELNDSIITYRSRYSRPPELLPVMDLVVFDESNPHSVAFQFDLLTNYLGAMKRDIGDLPETSLQTAIAELQRFDMNQLAGMEAGDRDRSTACRELAGRLAKVSYASRELSDRLAMRYFTHVGDVARQTLAL